MIDTNGLGLVRAFLRNDSGQAFLVSEVAAGVRSAGLAETDVIAALRELEQRGEVVWRSFPVRDPHLAFESLEFVAAVELQGSEISRHQAELTTQRGFNNWLQTWLSGHRCS